MTESGERNSASGEERLPHASTEWADDFFDFAASQFPPVDTDRRDELEPGVTKVGELQIDLLRKIETERTELKISDPEIVGLREKTASAIEEILEPLEADEEELLKVAFHILKDNENDRLKVLRAFLPHVDFRDSQYTEEMISNQWNASVGLEHFIVEIMNMYWEQSFLKDLGDFLERSGLLIKDDTN